MELEQTNAGDHLVITLKESRLDAAIADQFKSTLVQLIDSGSNRLVLDLSSVDFIDSSGLGAVVSVLKGVGAHGSLRLCGLQDGVMSIFKLTRMNQVFSIHPTAEAAVAA
jgi:anti-sigma B factor antagonist